jgi:hypothetical protein
MTVKELNELLFNIPPEYQSFEIIIEDEQYNQELKLKNWGIRPTTRRIVFEGINYDCE